MGADFTAELLVRFYREPSRFRGEARRREAPPVDGDVILKLALGRRIEFTDPVLNEAGTAADLKEAAAMYVRHVFFRPDATPYQMLGLAPGASAQAIKERFRLLMQLVHPDRQDGGEAWPESFAALANQSYGVLRDEPTRSAYDRDAEERARVVRDLYRKAAAAEASLMPVVVWPARPGGRRPLGRPMWPEWLTAGVGGFVRAHPAVTAFVVLTVGSALAIGMYVSDRPEDLLMREVREALAPAAPGIPGGHTVADGSGIAGEAAVSWNSESARGAADAAVALADAPPVLSPGASAGAERPVAQGEVAPRVANGPGAVAGGRAPSGNEPGDVGATPAGGSPVRGGLIGNVLAAAAPEPGVTPSFKGVAEAVGSVTPVAPLPSPAVPASPPASPEIEALFAEFVASYEHGRLEAFAALFDADADTNLRHGRAAIRDEYEELFRLSSWRRMQLTRINWRRAGDTAYAKGEMAVRIGWRDGREVEQRVNVELDLVRRDGRTVIARLSHQPKNP